MKAAGFVLVGGRSSRMGHDKARLPVESRFLVEVIAAAVAEAAESVALVGNPAAFADLAFDCIPDMRPGLGPLAGLEAALATDRAAFNVIASCDMPGMRASIFKRLLCVCEETRALCTLVKDAEGRKHPLCAVYHRDCLRLVRKALDSNRLRLLDVVEELGAVEVPIDSVLSNVNTPEQWAAWQAAQRV
jgi:molybdopterin-guanine dinucleotide biosynthesis protein A